MNNPCSFIIVMVLFMAGTTHQAHAQGVPGQFSHLTKFNVIHSLEHHGIGEIEIFYEPGITSSINSVGHQTRDPEHYSPDRRLITTKIDRNAETQYIIEFTEGMSVVRVSLCM